MANIKPTTKLNIIEKKDVTYSITVPAPKVNHLRVLSITSFQFTMSILSVDTLSGSKSCIWGFSFIKSIIWFENAGIPDTSTSIHDFNSGIINLAININKIMTGGRQHQIRKLKWHFSNLLNPTDKK